MATGTKTLNEKQRQWLIDHIKIEKGLFKKSETKQIEGHVEKYEEFLDVHEQGLDAAANFDSIQIGERKATRLGDSYRTKFNDINGTVTGYDKDKTKDSMEKVLDSGIKAVKTEIGNVEKDLKKCESYKKSRDELSDMVEIMIKFCPDAATMLPLLRGVKSDVLDADMTARDGDLKTAASRLKKITSEISRLEQLIQDSHTKGHDVMLAQKVTSIKSSLTEIKEIEWSAKVIEGHEETLGQIEQLRKQAKFKDAITKAGNLEKSVASSRVALASYGQRYNLLKDYIKIAEGGGKDKKLEALQKELDELHDTTAGIEPVSAIKKIDGLLKSAKTLASKAPNGKDLVKNAKLQNDAKGKSKDEFDELKISVQKRLEEMENEPLMKEDAQGLTKQFQQVTKAEGDGDFIAALKQLKEVNGKVDEQHTQLNQFRQADSECTSTFGEVRSLLEKNKAGVSVVERLTKQQEKAQEVAKTAQKKPDAAKQLGRLSQVAKDITAELGKYLEIRKTITEHLEVIKSVPIGDTQEIENKFTKTLTEAEQQLGVGAKKATQLLESVHSEAKQYAEKLAAWAKGKGAEFDKKNDEITKLLNGLISGFDLGAVIVEDMETKRDQANLLVGSLQFEQADKNLSVLLEQTRTAAEHCKKLDEARRTINAFFPLLSEEDAEQNQKLHDKLLQQAVTGVTVGGQAAEAAVQEFVDLATRMRDEAGLTNPGAAMNAGAKLAYENALPPFEAVYKPFKALPLADEKPRTLFDGRYKSATEHAGKGEYEDAVRSLGALKELEQIYQPMAKAWETARDAYEKLATDSEGIYTDYAALVTQEVLTSTKEERAKIQAPVTSDKGATAEQFDEARKSTVNLMRKMITAIEKANKEVEAYEQTLKLVTGKMPDLAKTAAASSYQEALAEINKAAQLRSENKLVDATNLLKNLNSSGFDKLKQQSKEKADKWQEDGELMKEVKQLGEKIEGLPKEPPVHHLLTDLRDDLAILNYNVSDLREFDHGAELLEALKKRFVTASKTIKEDSEHRKKLQEWSKKVTEAFQSYSEAAEEVFKVLKENSIDEANVLITYKLGDKAGKHQMFRPLSLYQGSWLNHKKAYEDISLKALESMRDGAVQEFETAEQRCKELKGDQEFLVSAKAAQLEAKESEERKQAYELARKEVAEALEVCDQRGYEDFSKLNAQFGKLDSTVRKAKTYEESEYKSEFEKITKQCKDLVDPAETQKIDELSRDGAERLRGLKASYLAYVKADKYPKGMLDEMARQLKVAESMIHSGNLPAMQLGAVKLDEIKKSSDYMKGFDKGYDHNQKFLNETLKLRLEQKPLADHLPLTVEELEADRLELVKEAENLPPDKHLVLIQKFEQRVKEAQGKATELKQVRSDLKARRKQVDQALSALGYAVSKKLMKKELLGDFSDKILNLESEIKSSEEPLEANALMLQFDEIMNKIAYYVEHPSQLAADQQQARQELAELKQREKEWKETCKAFVAEYLTPTKDAVKREGKRGDQEALDELKKFADDTKEQVLKSHDWKSGESRLKLGRDQATQLINEPRGARVSSRKDVAKLAPDWNRIVQSETETIEKMLGAILDVAKEIEKKEQREKLIDSLSKKIKAKEVMTPFQANAFDRVCAQLGDDDLTHKEHLAMKELGLQVHRKMLAYLEKDPLVQHIRLNPFQGGVLKPVNDILNNLDLNLRRFG